MPPKASSKRTTFVDRGKSHKRTINGARRPEGSTQIVSCMTRSRLEKMIAEV